MAARKKLRFMARPATLAPMRAWTILLMVLTALFIAPVARAGNAKVVKVFPQYLDKQGRHTISPSLMGRDVFQADLRRHPSLRGGIRMVVEWKGKDVDWSHLRMRVEIRGLEGNTLRTETLEEPAVKNGWLNHWTELRLTGPKFVNFGNLVAWRATLLDGAKELSSQQSFLWDGVLPPPPQH
jgi:hypothetical protein